MLLAFQGFCRFWFEAHFSRELSDDISCILWHLVVSAITNKEWDKSKMATRTRRDLGRKWGNVLWTLRYFGILFLHITGVVSWGRQSWEILFQISEKKNYIFRNGYRIQGGELNGGQDSVFVCCFNPTKTGESGQVYCEKQNTSNKLQHICNCIHQRNCLLKCMWGIDKNSFT